MYSKKFIKWTIGVLCSLLLVSCGSNPPNPNVQVNEHSVETISFDETIHTNNCGNPASSEQTKERSFSTDLEGTVGLGFNYLIEGSITGKYEQYRSATTSQKLTAAPNTNMEFVLRRSEEVRAGNVTVNGKAGDYSVQIPVLVEQVLSRDLGCSGAVINPTSDTHQPEPDSTNTQCISAPPTGLIHFWQEDSMVWSKGIWGSKNLSEFTVDLGIIDTDDPDFGEFRIWIDPCLSTTVPGHGYKDNARFWPRDPKGDGLTSPPILLGQEITISLQPNTGKWGLGNPK